MTKNAITWIREDFRIENNPALSYATQNHENVLALYIYNKNDFDNKREAQNCLLYTSDAADERSSVDLGGRRIIKKKTIFQYIGIKFMSLT